MDVAALAGSDAAAVTLRLRLAELLRARGDHRGGHDEVERALALAPREPSVVGLFAELGLALGDAGGVLRVATPLYDRLDAPARLAVATAALAVHDLAGSPERDPLVEEARRAARGPDAAAILAGLRACGRRDLAALLAGEDRPPSPERLVPDRSLLEPYFCALWEIPRLADNAHAAAMFEWLMRAAGSVGPGDVVLDAGSGEQRYLPFFAHAEYLSTDFGKGDAGWRYGGTSFFSDLEALPLRSCSVQLVLSTSTLEHVRHPLAAMREAWRVLRWGGTLRAYVPFFYPEHQKPHDFHRFTCHAWETLCAEAGFTRWEIVPASSDWYAASTWFRLACARVAARMPAEVRRVADAFIRRVLPEIASLHAPSDPQEMPIGYFVDAWKLP